MQKLTIQINNLEALERLIGGDTEVEIEIRNSIAQAFAKKHLKQLITEQVVTNAIQEAYKYVNNEAFSAVKEGYSTKYVLSERMKKDLVEEFGTMFREKVRSVMDELGFSEDRVKEIITTMTSNASNRIKQSLEDKILIDMIKKDLKTKVDDELKKLLQ